MLENNLVDGLRGLEREKFVVSYAMRHQNHTGAAIARELGLDERYVQKTLKKHGLQRTPNNSASDKQSISSQKETKQKDSSGSNAAVMDEASIVEELGRIFGSWEGTITQEDQKEEEQQKGKKEPAIRRKRHILEKYPRRQIDAWGNVHSAANLYTMNVWNYGQRLSPRIVRELKEEYSLPGAYIKLISNVDGAIPEWDAFTVEIDSNKSKTYRLRYLLPALNVPQRGEETLREANEKVKELHEGFIAFAYVGKDIYLAFSQEEHVYLLEKGKEIHVANDIVEFCGMLQTEADV